MVEDPDPISQLINDQLPKTRRRRFTSSERLVEDVGLHPLLVNEVVDDIEIEFGVQRPPAVRQAIADRTARGEGPVLFDTRILTVGDLRLAVSSGVWPERAFDLA